jgi:hypothetical protein
VVGPSPRSGEAESGPGGRARRRPSSEVEAESEPWGRARRSPSSEVEVDVILKLYTKCNKENSSFCVFHLHHKKSTYVIESD